jgi:hypothetical protein
MIQRKTKFKEEREMKNNVEKVMKDKNPVGTVYL